MELKLKTRTPAVLLALLCSFWFTLPSLAASLAGNVDSIKDNGVKGWAWNNQKTDETVTIELTIYEGNSQIPAKVLAVKADQYDAELSESIGDGNHSFFAPINWQELTGDTFLVEAYAISGEEKLLLPSTAHYTKEAPSSSEEVGPGIPAKAKTGEEPQETAASSIRKGVSLGNFTSTAYCDCKRCGSGKKLTYAGTVPQADHTISADLNVFPLGTKLMIGDTVYTVEDKGQKVFGKKLDIYFNSHKEALDYGRKTVEVFAVEEY